MNWFDPDGDSLFIDYDDLLTASPDIFEPETPRRVNVGLLGITLPLLVVRQKDADRVVILNNGAVDLKRSQGRPVFQRSSWWPDLASHQIYICDPGTVGPKALSINWFQTQPPLWIPSKVAGAARRISALLGVENAQDRTYYGSSAGGFAALLQLCGDSRAKAVINNAQFDWTRWFAPNVHQVLAKNFESRLAADVRAEWPHRANALQYLLRRSSDWRIQYHVNMASKYDAEIQYPIFMDFLQENPGLCRDITVHHYFDPQMGHNPISKPETLSLLSCI